MRKRTTQLEEQISLRPQDIFLHQNDLESQELLLFVTSTENLKIKRVNLKTLNFFKTGISDIQDEGLCFYKEVIHPNDYPDFITQLHSCKDLHKGEAKEITVRLKGANNKWKKFRFLHRLYQAPHKEDDVLVLGIAKEIQHKASRSDRRIPHAEIEKLVEKGRYKYDLLLKTMDNGFCIIDLIFNLQKKPVDFIYLEFNPAFREQARIRSSIGKTMLEIVPGHEEHWFNTYGEVALTGTPVRFQNYTVNGRKNWYEVFAFPISTKRDGSVALIFSDITRRKIAEEELRVANEQLEERVIQRTKQLQENSRLLQTIFDSTTEGIIVLKPVYDNFADLIDFIYLRVNTVIVEHYDREITGESYLRTNPDAIDIGVFGALKRTMYTGIPEDFEIKYKTNGQFRWYRITTRRQDELLISSLEDITRRKQEAHRLKDNIRFKKQIADTSPDIILILDLYKEEVRYINRSIASHPGLRKREIDGLPAQNIIPFIHPHDREKALEFHSHLMRSSDREILDVEFRIKTRENHWEWFNARGKVFMRNRSGSVCEYILLLRNIEQQKRTQQALLHAEKLSIKGEVARTLAHELRNPMASIGMAADILTKKFEGQKDKQFVNYVNIIKRSNTVLNRLVTDLLNAAKYTPLSPERCCLAETLDKALQSAEDRIYLVGIKIIKNYSGNYFILADTEKLQIALLNIIVNACEAMNPHEGILNLTIERLKNNYRLTITDNGCGMEKNQLEKLFDAFYTQKPQGVGVGLSSVKSILEEHDATVLVESEPNKGTTFHLTFHSYQDTERS